MIRAVQLYTFLQYCNESSLEKEVLECGAGGWPSFEPLLVRFYNNGYKVHGIEISAERLAHAQDYCTQHHIEADLRQGDMRQLPYQDDSLSFVFSYNAIFHMRKTDVTSAVREIHRVLKPNGLCFINFLSHQDDRYGQGKKLGLGEYAHQESGDQSFHVYHDDHEADSDFKGFKILQKEKRTLWLWRDGKEHRRGYIDYIAQKY